MSTDQEQSAGQGEQASVERMSAVQAAERARQQLAEFVEREIDTISSVSSSEGTWTVDIEVVELERLPQSTDVLGTYHVTLDEQGNLQGYERTARYLRSEGR